MTNGIKQQIADSVLGDIITATERLWTSPDFAAMGSEIERAFAAHFVLASRIAGGDLLVIGLPTQPSSGFFLAPQHQIGKYRVDFLFGFAGRTALSECVAIECDGFDFHDRTPEQASRDKARDRELNQHVKAVVRFSGSEIYRDVGQCWLDAIAVLGRDWKAGA